MTGRWVLVVAVLGAVVIEVVLAQQEPVRSRPSDEDLQKVPDLTNPKNKRELECNSCRAFAKEVYDRVTAVSKLRHGHAKHFELVDAVDKVCFEMGTTYGLLLKNNQATTEFSSNKAITRYQGAWINTFLERRCGELLEKYDDDLLREVLRHETLGAFRNIVCNRWEKSCTSRNEAAREDL